MATPNYLNFGNTPQSPALQNTISPNSYDPNELLRVLQSFNTNKAPSSTVFGVAPKIAPAPATVPPVAANVTATPQLVAPSQQLDIGLEGTADPGAGFGFDHGVAPNETIPGLGNEGGFDGYAALKGFGAAAQGIGALYGAYTGAQQVKLGKNQLDFAKQSFDTNLANQAKLTNLQLADRRRRELGYTQDRSQVDSAAGKADVEAFLDKNKIKGTR